MYKFLLFTLLSPQLFFAQDAIFEVKNGVMEELDNPEKVYNDNGAYNRVFEYGFDKDNDCILHIYQFSGLVHPGNDEYGELLGMLKITIDLSGATVIKSSTTNFGYPCIMVGGMDYPVTRSYYNKQTNQYDQDTTQLKSFTLAIDSSNLVGLLKEWSGLCRK